MRYIYSVGPRNGIYKWAFYGDKEMPEDITAQYEKTAREAQLEEAKDGETNHPIFDQG